MKEKTVFLIAYGTLMTGERNHRFCENAVSITPCIVKGTLYDTGYGFPAFVPEGTTEVKAELIEIPISAWADVDRLEGYPRMYDRRLYPTTLADGTKTRAWIYVMNRLPPQSTVIESGDWKNRQGH